MDIDVSDSAGCRGHGPWVTGMNYLSGCLRPSGSFRPIHSRDLKASRKAPVMARGKFTARLESWTLRGPRGFQAICYQTSCIRSHNPRVSPEPQRIGPYTIIRPLGQGGMGVVYLARDAGSRLVALKKLREGPTGDAGFRRRFTREVEAARSVARFCTAPVLDAGIDGESAYIVTEYVDGPDLAGAIRKSGPMAGADLEALAVGVATALTAIHQAGVVHRDLKPQNILLSPVGPRVIDFGIAQLVEPDASRSTGIVGTPAYMSPEQATDGRITAASDVFAWGGVVAYAATGRPPFGTGGAPEVLFRVVHRVPDLRGVDERLRPLVEQALDKDPARRPTAQQLLDRLLGRESVSVDTGVRTVSSSWTASHPRPAGRWKAQVAVAAALLVTGATVAAAWRPWETAADLGPSPTTSQAAYDGSVPPLAQRDTSVRNLDSQVVPVRVTIDNLYRVDGYLRLELTVRNDAKDGAYADLYTILGRDSEDLSSIGLTYNGAPKTLRPHLDEDGTCICSSWTSVNNIAPGKSLMLVAEFGEVPWVAKRADLDLLGLGKFKDVPIT
ncbi:serine/threonine-protein kinase [Nonomuraea sp. NPDC005650]|uniref:serine/threonine-protein kinase n=1 Tax=Nonomuraea sp. NPDC005650 TaxID=3157045 RepID=UPI0033B1BC75